MVRKCSSALFWSCPWYDFVSQANKIFHYDTWAQIAKAYKVYVSLSCFFFTINPPPLADLGGLKHISPTHDTHPPLRAPPPFAIIFITLDSTFHLNIHPFPLPCFVLLKFNQTHQTLVLNLITGGSKQNLQFIASYILLTLFTNWFFQWYLIDPSASFYWFYLGYITS